MLWVFADCLKLMIGFCNDFGFFDWFLGGGRSSNSVVIGGTCKKWTCSTMTSWRKSIEYEEHLFLLLLKLLLFNKKWRSRHCFALHFDFLKTDRFLLQSVSFLLRLVLTDFFFSICFFCSTHAFRSASQSSRSAAAEATAQRSPQVIFLGIHTAKYSVMSTRIAAVFWAESAQCWGEGLRLPTADSSL